MWLHKKVSRITEERLRRQAHRRVLQMRADVGFPWMLEEDEAASVRHPLEQSLGPPRLLTTRTAC